jgi:hypothetical protein
MLPPDIEVLRCGVKLRTLPAALWMAAQMWCHTVVERFFLLQRIKLDRIRPQHRKGLIGLFFETL